MCVTWGKCKYIIIFALYIAKIIKLLQDIFQDLYNHAKFKGRNNILCVEEQDISIITKLLIIYAIINMQN